MTSTPSEPRIYVACLASYNSGTLHGQWIDAAQGLDEIREEIQAMLEASPAPKAEEYAIHDHEGFGGLSVPEYPNLDELRRAALLLLEHPHVAGPLMEHYGGLSGVEEATDAMRDQYLGLFADPADWAYESLTEMGALQGLSESLRPYFDFDRYARDVELNGDIFVLRVAQQIHIFWNQ